GRRLPPARRAGVSRGGRAPGPAGLGRSRVAGALGYPEPEAIDPDRAFKDIGFDSLTAVDLRNRLAKTTGLQLSVTLVFDHPTITALVGHLRGELLGAAARTAPAAPIAPVRPAEPADDAIA